ncbi:MAG: protein-tyrosine-phosphatase, partial [Bacteroidota bacterium]
MRLFPQIETYIHSLRDDMAAIPAERQQLLREIAAYIQSKLNEQAPIRMIFICTHNSRRSHLGQIWAKTLADFHALPDVQIYSGGTEATAFNPHAIAALHEAGFDIKGEEATNPHYAVNYLTKGKPMTAWSKVYSDPVNPQKDFAALMTCNEADEACPIVFGNDARFALT